MSTNACTSGESIDPRPNYFALGVDETGAHHCYCTKTDRVYAVADGDVSHVQDLNGRSLDEWMEFVDVRRGWDSRRYGRSLVDVLVEGLEGATV